MKTAKFATKNPTVAALEDARAVAEAQAATPVTPETPTILATQPQPYVATLGTAAVPQSAVTSPAAGAIAPAPKGLLATVKAIPWWVWLLLAAGTGLTAAYFLLPDEEEGRASRNEGEDDEESVLTPRRAKVDDGPVEPEEAEDPEDDVIEAEVVEANDGPDEPEEVEEEVEEDEPDEGEETT